MVKKSGVFRCFVFLLIVCFPLIYFVYASFRAPAWRARSGGDQRTKPFSPQEIAHQCDPPHKQSLGPFAPVTRGHRSFPFFELVAQPGSSRIKLCLIRALTCKDKRMPFPPGQVASFVFVRFCLCCCSLWPVGGRRLNSARSVSVVEVDCSGLSFIGADCRC